MSARNLREHPHEALGLSSPRARASVGRARPSDPAPAPENGLPGSPAEPLAGNSKSNFLFLGREPEGPAHGLQLALDAGLARPLGPAAGDEVPQPVRGDGKGLVLAEVGPDVGKVRPELRKRPQPPDLVVLFQGLQEVLEWNAFLSRSLEGPDARSVDRDLLPADLEQPPGLGLRPRGPGSLCGS